MLIADVICIFVVIRLGVKKKMGAGVTFMKIINHQFDFKTTGNSWLDTQKNCSSKQVSEND